MTTVRQSVRRWCHGARLGLVVGVGLMLIRVGLALMVPLGSAPDEPGHFLKAHSAARFEFGDTSNVPTFEHPSENDLLNQSLGAVFDMGSDAVNPTWSCNAFQPKVPAACVDLNATTYPGDSASTAFGTFQPFLYVVLGLPSLAIHDPDTSMLAMRLVVVVWSSLLVTAGLVVIGRRRTTRLVMAATIGLTPMVLYTQGTLGTSGIETAAAFAAFFAGIDVLGGTDSRRLSRYLLPVALVCLTLCRPMSVYVAVVIAGLVVLTTGWRDAVTRVRALPRRYTLTVLGLTVLATAANIGWSLASPDIYFAREAQLGKTLGHYTLSTLPILWRMVIGVFGWIDTDLPFMVLVAAWAAIAVVLCGVSPRRDRVASWRLWFLIATTVAFGFVAEYTVFARIGDGSGVQGRHLLPLFQLWAPVAVLPNRGERCTGDRDRVAHRRLQLSLLTTGAIVGLSALYIARRDAVGTSGPLFFFGTAAWHPAAGWVVPFGLIAVGLVVGYLAPLAGPRQEAVDTDTA